VFFCNLCLLVPPLSPLQRSWSAARRIPRAASTSVDKPVTNTQSLHSIHHTCFRAKLVNIFHLDQKLGQQDLEPPCQGSQSTSGRFGLLVLFSFCIFFPLSLFLRSPLQEGASHQAVRLLLVARFALAVLVFFSFALILIFCFKPKLY
jgi:hypothetical protein